jgi:IMP dehydrogenase/GMP reductase
MATPPGSSLSGNHAIREAFTFDDVLLKPGLSDVLPSEVDIRSHVTRAIPLNIPIMASAMDTVTEARMAIAMAQAGGVGVIHRNFDAEGQAAQVRQVRCDGLFAVFLRDATRRHPRCVKQRERQIARCLLCPIQLTEVLDG